MEFDISISTVIAFVSVLILYYVLKRPKNLPPGPTGFPLLGYLPFLGNYPYRTFVELAKRYKSQVIGLQLGTRYVVVLNDWISVKEGSNNESLLGRPSHTPFAFIKDSFPVLMVESSGPLWREHKKFAMHALKDMGVGKKDMEIFIKEELTELVSHLKEAKGQPSDISQCLRYSIPNIITALMVGQRYEYTDPRRGFIKESIELFFAGGGATAGQAFFPFILNIVAKYKLFGLKKLVNETKKLAAFFDKEISEHQKTYDENYMRDYIDRFLKKMKTSDDPRNTYTLDMLKGNLWEFFAGGGDTAANTLHWLFLLMTIHPEIQQKIKKEIRDVIGLERSPEMSDIKNMHYTQAVLRENNRYSSIGPLGLLRGPAEDTRVQGFNIPAGTPVIFNLWALHHDPKYWPEPDKFDPGRFLNSDGHYTPTDESYAPFSLGKRSCPGEILAHYELFLFAVTLLQKFTIRLPENVKTPVDLEPRDGRELNLVPKLNMLRFIEDK